MYVGVLNSGKYDPNDQSYCTFEQYYSCRRQCHIVLSYSYALGIWHYIYEKFKLRDLHTTHLLTRSLADSHTNTILSLRQRISPKNLSFVYDFVAHTRSRTQTIFILFARHALCVVSHIRLVSSHGFLMIIIMHTHGFNSICRQIFV